MQPSDRGTWAPKPGADGTYTLTLTGAAAQTVYFSDRPERIVGLAPTQRFLDGLGFTPVNPPNAALVATQEGSEEQDILVIELLNPGYDADAGTLVYEARVLADYAEPGLGHLARQQTDYELPESFGTGSLFIDDCADSTDACWRFYYNADDTPCDKYALAGYMTIGNCWNSNALRCEPCRGYTNLCYSTFSSVCTGPTLPMGRAGTTSTIADHLVVARQGAGVSVHRSRPFPRRPDPGRWCVQAGVHRCDRPAPGR